jgi:hypothetical protein
LPRGFPIRQIHLADYPRLGRHGIPGLIRQPEHPVPFLLDLFRIPADTFQLFLASAVINAHFGTLLAAMHTLTVGVLGACATAGLVRHPPSAFMRYLAITTALTVGLIVGHASFLRTRSRNHTRRIRSFGRCILLHQAADVVVHRTRPRTRRRSG